MGDTRGKHWANCPFPFTTANCVTSILATVMLLKIQHAAQIASGHFALNTAFICLKKAAQAAYRTGSTKTVRWARARAAAVKNHNVVICALARKMLVKGWHILMGHPVPDREDEESFTCKLRKLAYAIGKEKLSELGFKNRKQYAESVCAKDRPPSPTKLTTKLTTHNSYPPPCV